LAAVEEVAPGVETLRPGVCALAVRGPARYFGGEAAAAEHIVEHVAQQCSVEAQVGIADGTFAAGLAARAGKIIPAGETRGFLAGLGIAALGRPDLVDLLRRLGIHTLGAFAGLPAGVVLARFGFDAALAHRLAAGGDDRPLAPRQPPPDLDVTERFDEPVERVDAAAFAARALAERLHAKLTSHGLACTRLVIEASTALGEELQRTWRHDGLLNANAIADRLRWQLDGWLTGLAGRGGRRSGLTGLRLSPEGVLVHAGLQPGLWGEAGEERDRAHRALSHVQGLLGPDSVFTPVLDGGRVERDHARLVPWGDERVPTRPVEPPWPGRLPAPSPATVYVEPVGAKVYAADGALVGVTGRLLVTGAPALVALAGEPAPVEVTGWAGPWPVDERWWSDGEAHRCARFQVLLADGRALLLVLEAGHWSAEGMYD
jgi:protein ImuB